MMIHVAHPQIASDDRAGGERRSSSPSNLRVYDMVMIALLAAGVAASLVWTTLLGWLLVNLVGARVMLLNAGLDLLTENWPYAAFAALVVVLVVLLRRVRRTSRRIRALESQVHRLRSDVGRLNQFEARQLLEKINPMMVKADRADEVSIVPAATADEHRDNLVD